MSSAGHIDPDTLAVLALEGGPGEATERAHVESCSACREELDALRGTVALARTLDAGEREERLPPPRVWHGIVNELASSGAVPAGPEAATGTEPAAVAVLTPGGDRNPWPWLAAAAGLVIVAVVAAVLVVREPAPTLVADTTLEPLAEVEPGVARLLEGPGGIELEIETADLPEPDGYYELWLIDTEVSQLVSLGPLEDRRYRLPAGLDVASFPVVDVSLEDFDGDPAHSGNSVLRGVLPLDAEG